MAKKNALGRGLGALIEDADSRERIIEVGMVNEIEINKIEANPFQPRKKFDEDALKELSTSIKELGVIQPVTVRKINDNKFQLIAGERRFRASKLAGLKLIPAYVRSADDQGMIEMALVENIQREELDSIEVAISFQRLIEECTLTQESLSERVGKKRSTVTNYLRLLKLPAEIQLGIKEKKITMGHARTIIGLEDAETQIMIFNQIVKYDFSVRKVEEVVREMNSEPKKKEKTLAKSTNTAEEYIKLQKHLAKYFNSKVEFKRNSKGKGRITIPFNTDKELEGIIGVLDKLNS